MKTEFTEIFDHENVRRWDEVLSRDASRTSIMYPVTVCLLLRQSLVYSSITMQAYDGVIEMNRISK